MVALHLDPSGTGGFVAGYQASTAGGSSGFPQSGGLGSSGSLTHIDNSAPVAWGPESGSPAQFRLAEEGALGGRTKDTELRKLLLNGINSPDDVTALQIQLIKANYLNPKSAKFSPGVANEGDATYWAFDKMLNNSIDFNNSSSGPKTNYLDMLSKQADAHPDSKNYRYFLAKFGADGGGPADGGVKQIHSSATTVSTPLDVQGLLRQKFQQYEGRDPSSGELAAFTSALQQAQRSSPTVTDGSYDPALGYRGDRNSVTTGGLSAGAADAMAETYATTGANQKDANTHAIHGYASQLESLLKGGG